MARRKADTTAEAEVGNSATADSNKFLHLATRVASAYVANNHVAAADLPLLLKELHESFAHLAGAPAELAKQPAVPIKRSVTDEFVICLEDGKKLRTLKRYLATQYDMTPEQYRAKWGLPRDYPMVAPAYAKLRSAFAKKIGLGRKPSVRKRQRA